MPETAESPLTAPLPNGYHFPPRHSALKSSQLLGNALWKYVRTPVGFLVVLYALNIVAWGGMLFLLLCNAAPAMCKPSCDDINSPRRKWIEWDSQILNALFCVTGFGLAPWRFRDLYYLLQHRLLHKHLALRRLAGIYRSWYRLPASGASEEESCGYSALETASEEGFSGVPHPESKAPDPPLTGCRAPATQTWKLDLVIWLFVFNTLLQGCLAGFMWGYNRYNRPSWATGLFVVLACSVAGGAGVIAFLEGKKVKGIEGVPVSEEDRMQLEEDRSRGIFHYNNLSDKRPKAQTT